MQAQSVEPAIAPVSANALVPVRPRADGWTPEKQRAFLDHLADTGCVREAAALVDMTEQSAYRLRRRADASAFDAAWEAALERGLQRLTGLAFDRAVNGARRTRWWKGELVGEERVPSDKMLIWLIRNGASVLGRRQARGAVTRDWEGAMEAIEAPRLPGEPLGGYRVWINEHRFLVTNFPPAEDWNDELSHHGRPGDLDYWRRLGEEEDAWLARYQVTDAAADPVEAERRRYFGLEG